MTPDGVILLLGPSRWRRGFRPQVPPEIAAALPRWWTHRASGTPWPIDLRAYLADVLRQEHHPATLMEAEGRRRTAVLETEFFLELVEQLPVTRFFAFWPRGANPSGLLWELPLIVERAGKEPFTAQSLHVFPQTGVADWDTSTGRIEFVERGARTTYLRDLARVGFQFWPWATYDELVQSVRTAARVRSPR